MFRTILSGRVRFAAFLALVVVFWPLSALAASPHQLDLLSSDQSTPATLSWRIVPSPNVDDNGDLYGITARCMRDVWAVGSYYTSDAQRQTLIEHWDGVNWKVTPSPNMPGLDNYLTAVTTLSPHAAVAVGYYFTSARDALPLILYWNGTRWSIMSGPNVGDDGVLHGVTAVSARNAWAVGDFYNTSISRRQTLIEHWDGARWKVAPSPNMPGLDNYLSAVAAHSASDVWAVGSYLADSAHTLILHWNGAKWSIVPSPDVSGGWLNGVTATSTHDAWAVGTSSSFSRTLIEHWDGTTWRVISSPNVGSPDNQLNSVTALSPHNAWAVGRYSDPTNASQYRTLIEYWDGASWKVVQSPNIGTYTNGLFGVVALSRGNVWAVGDYYDSNGRARTLVEAYP